MRTSALAFLALLLPLGAAAQESAAFLETGVGARALGMGGAYTALAEGADAIAWNPAGLAGSPRRELAFSRVELLEDARVDTLHLALPSRLGTFGAGARHLGHERLDGRDAAGRATGGFYAADDAAELGYGARLSESARVGGAARYVKSRLAEASAQAFAFDLGGMYRAQRRGPGVPEIGLAARNIGSRMRYDEQSAALPLVLAAGLAYRLPSELVLAADYRHRPYAASSEVAVGAEWTRAFSRDLSGSLRGGADFSRLDIGGLAPFSLGAGLRWSSVEASFAWRPGGGFGDSFVYTLTARL